MALDFSLFGQLLQAFDFGLQGALIPLGLTGVCAVAITRNTRNLKLLVFPLLLGFMRLGFNIPWMFIGASVLLWVVTIVGAHEIGAVMSSMSSIATGGLRAAGKGTSQGVGALGFVKKRREKKLFEKAFAEEKQGLRKDRFLEPIRSQRDIRKVDYGEWLKDATRDQRMSRAIKDSAFKGQLSQETQFSGLQKNIGQRIQRFKAERQFEEWKEKYLEGLKNLR